MFETKCVSCRNHCQTHPNDAGFARICPPVSDVLGSHKPVVDAFMDELVFGVCGIEGDLDREANLVVEPGIFALNLGEVHQWHTAQISVNVHKVCNTG